MLGKALGSGLLPDLGLHLALPHMIPYSKSFTLHFKLTKLVLGKAARWGNSQNKGQVGSYLLRMSPAGRWALHIIKHETINIRKSTCKAMLRFFLIL